MSEHDETLRLTAGEVTQVVEALERVLRAEMERKRLRYLPWTDPAKMAAIAEEFDAQEAFARLQRNIRFAKGVLE